jgi:hypothetical protein
MIPENRLYFIYSDEANFGGLHGYSHQCVVEATLEEAQEIGSEESYNIVDWANSTLYSDAEESIRQDNPELEDEDPTAFLEAVEEYYNESRDELVQYHIYPISAEHLDIGQRVLDIICAKTDQQSFIDEYCDEGV